MNPSEYRPTVDEIGVRLYARTLDTDNGKRVGTFTDKTSPTATAVDALIDDSMSVVESEVGQKLDGEWFDGAKRCVIFHTAMLIELSYYPESTNAGDSSYKSWEQRYNDAIQKLSDAINQDRPGSKRIQSVEVFSPVRMPPGGRLDPWGNVLLP